MNKAKRLYALLGVLVVLCAAAFIVSRHENKKEEICASGETVFTLSPADVTALEWERGGATLAFSKGEDGAWHYDGDEDFPVDADKINERLALFEAFNAAFTIENADDLAPYGLDAPECTVRLTTGEGVIKVTMGDYSKMDAQRYVSFGGENVYLAASDPVDMFPAELAAMIKNDATPDTDTADSIVFTGADSYEIRRDEDGKSLCEDDVYFADDLPLDTERVEKYLRVLSSLTLGDYATYKLNDDDLSFYGLDEPTLTVELEYTDDDGEQRSFTFAVGQNASEVEIAEKNGEDTSEVQAYARIGTSRIVYELNATDFAAVCAAARDDLRHRELFTGDFAAVTAMELELDGEQYTLEYTESEAEESGLLSKAEKVWRYNGAKLDTDAVSGIENALLALTADSFTDEKADGREEMRITLRLDNAAQNSLTISLYRRDGEMCLAEVDGESVALVTREQMTKLKESVYAVVLGAAEDETETESETAN